MKRELENNSNDDDDDDDDNDNKIAEVSAILEGRCGGRNSLHDYTEKCHLTVLKPVIWLYHGERVVDGV